jgi:hypothetical protein
MNNISELNLKNLKNLKNLYLNITGENYDDLCKAPEAPSYLILRKIGLGFVLPLAMSLNGAGEFLFCFEILKSFLKLSHPVLLISSGIMMLLSSALFYSFEIALLKKALGIPEQKSVSAKRIEEQIACVKLVIEINRAYENINNLDRVIGDPEKFAEIEEEIKKINQIVTKQKNYFDPGREALVFRLLRNFITLHGAFMAVAGGYFFAKSLMLVLCPFILSSPIGMIVIGLTCVVSVSLYCAMRASGMMNLKSPRLMLAHQLKKELNDFKQLEDKTYELVRRFGISTQKTNITSSNITRRASESDLTILKTAA